MAKLNLKTVNKKTKDQLITFVLVIAVYIVVQIMVAAGAISSLMQGLLVPMCTYSIVAIGLNLCVGYLGELSIGHAGFMCVGAFSSAFCTKLLEGVIGSQIVLFIIALLVGTAMAAFFGFLIGIPVLRLRGDYLAIVTLAFGEIIKNIINVLYIAKDGSGFHFAISNGNAIDLADDGLADQRCEGNRKDSASLQLYSGRDLNSDFFICCIQSGQFQKRPCDHGNP